MERVVSTGPNPHEPYIRYVAPTPAAPPKGSTFDTALDERLATNAWGWVRPGNECVSTPV